MFHRYLPFAFFGLLGCRRPALLGIGSSGFALVSRSGEGDFLRLPWPAFLLLFLLFIGRKRTKKDLSTFSFLQVFSVQTGHWQP
jgi:hypothetical protein